MSDGISCQINKKPLGLLLMFVSLAMTILLGACLRGVQRAPVEANGTIYSNSENSTLPQKSSIPSIENVADTPADEPAVSSLFYYRAIIGRGSDLFINVPVKNQGNATETFVVTAYYNDTPVIIEGWPDDTNITQIFWSWGDVNKDGHIDDWDLNAIMKAFNSRPGNQSWNPEADIYTDGIVNMRDMALCIRYYGKDIWTSFGLPKLYMDDEKFVTLLSGNSADVMFRWGEIGMYFPKYIISAYAYPLLSIDSATARALANFWGNKVCNALINDTVRVLSHPVLLRTRPQP